MSRITTHVLDTSLGKPASGITIALEKKETASWKKISEGITNNDGRISDFPNDKTTETGIYRLIFDTQSYFKKQNKKTFYLQITIEFEITDNSHYHVPLLLNPFGYSTYRGS